MMINLVSTFNSRTHAFCVACLSHSQNANFKASANVKQSQIEKLREELESASSAKEFLEEQLESERSKSDGDNEFAGFGAASGGSLGSELGALGGSPQMSLKEKCARLEREVRTLKAGGGGGGGEDAALLQSQMEDLKVIRSKLETQLAESGTKMAELEAERDELNHSVRTLQAQQGDKAGAAAAVQSADDERNEKNKEMIAALRKQVQCTFNCCF